MIKKYLFGSVVAVLLASSSTMASAEPRYAGSFESAKNAAWRIYSDNRVDQYCGCKFDNKGRVDLGSCGYSVRKDGKRAQRIEWEHVAPAHALGQHFSCWREGGREHCNKTDQAFRNAHNDLVNLIPVVGEVNGNRSNFRFDELPQGYGQYGACPFKVDFQNRRAEPPPALKGDIARINFYMRDVHGLKLSKQQTRLFEIWSRQDPVDRWELERDKRIFQRQGSSNPYVTGERVVGSTPATNEIAVAARQVEPTLGAPVSQANGFSCSTQKTCKAMSSCDEAVYHLQACNNSRLDGNGDGVPCEAICK